MKRILLLCLINILFAQGLFESAQTGTSFAYDLNGDFRSDLQIDNMGDSLYTKHLYSQFSLKFKVQKARIGYAFAEIRFMDSYYFDDHQFEIDLREAYIDISLGPLTTRMGKQIVAWGKTDVFRATDNITPQNMTYMPLDRDDMRMGNTVINTALNIGSAVQLQGIWIPRYIPNTLPISVFSLPQGVSYTGVDLPDNYFSNSGAAIKLDLHTSEYDVALSYLNAYALQPGFSSEVVVLSPTLVTYNFFQNPWRQEVIGFDAAANINAWSIRFEGAYILPDNDAPQSPNREVQLTAGIDRAWGAFHFLFEYNAKIIPDFTELLVPEDPALLMAYQLDIYTRLFFRQTDEMLQTIFVRPALSLFHEKMEVEVPISYNLTTKEYLIAPRLRIDLADALQLSLAASLYHGGENTLFQLLKPLYNGYFCELKLSF